MANNPHYNSWLFRDSPSKKPRPERKVLLTVLNAPSADTELTTVAEERSELDRHRDIRRAIERFEEAKLLKKNLTDLW